MAKKILNPATITNIHDEHFKPMTNGIITDVPILAKAAVYDFAESVTLYSFNIKNGKATSRLIKMPTCKIKASFARAFAVAWYESQYANAHVVYDTLPSDRDNYTDEENAAFDAVRQRYEIIRDVRNAHRNVTPCTTINNLINAIVGAKEDKYTTDVLDAFKTVKTAYAAMNKNPENATVNFTALHEAMKKVTAALWVPSDHCEEWRFNAPRFMARRVYQRFYDGMKLNKKGLYIETEAEDKVPLAEIILDAFSFLQNKDPEKSEPKAPKAKAE